MNGKGFIAMMGVFAKNFFFKDFIMKSWALSVLVTLGFSCFSPSAWSLDFSLSEQAATLSAKVDSYAAYCGQDSMLSKGFMDKFADSDFSMEQKNQLNESVQKTQEMTALALKEKNADCKSIDFMVERFQLMRQLKDVSYRLNGIDPATIPDKVMEGMPDPEALFPPERGELPFGDDAVE